MRYYLDTNILAFLRINGYPDISQDVEMELRDYSSLLYTSSICVQELIHLTQIGRLGNSRHNSFTAAKQIVPWLHATGISIVPINELHLQTMAELPLYDDHHDPADRLIIAQAITDHITLVSSDSKFKLYEPCGLQFFFNKR